MKHAMDWNIPCVSSKWLWDSIERGERLLFDDYLVHRSETEDRSSTLPSLRRPSIDDGIHDSRRCKSDVSRLKSVEVKPKKGNSTTESMLLGCVVSVSKLFKVREIPFSTNV